MPKAIDFQNVLQSHLRSETRVNANVHRGYLGMSGIGTCPLQQYNKFFSPEQSDAMSWYNLTGYHTEGLIVDVIKSAGFGADELHNKSLVADFDERYRGHVDYVADDGTLLEIKTVSWSKYNRLRNENRAPQYNTDQVQAYMRHGGFERAVLFFWVRDVPYWFWQATHEPGSWGHRVQQDEQAVCFWAIDIEPDQHRQDELDFKAKMILECIDRLTPPEADPDYYKR